MSNILEAVSYTHLDVYKRQVLIVWVGGHNVDQGVMQVGDMMAFIQYTMQIVMAF